jgi:hypothetical protein
MLESYTFCDVPNYWKMIKTNFLIIIIFII